MSSKYIDRTCELQVIGCVFNNPNILNMTDKYNVVDEDFPDPFHRIVFGAIYKIHELGAEKITLENIADFLATRPKSETIYKDNAGEKWLLEVSEAANQMSFDYYYSRLKKMTLLRTFDNYGINVSDIYDPDNILDIKKKQLQEDILDNSTLLDLWNKVNNKIDEIRMTYVNDDEIGEASHAGDGILDLIEKFKQTPEVGVPLYGPLINTVTRGARLKKFYLRSAASGVGKTRSMIADACYIGCSKIYDESFGWISSGLSQPVLYITTEQELDEIQTMMLAFLSNVNEEHILNGKYEGDEEDRVVEAANILSKSQVYVEELHDFSLQDVEDTIKKNLREHDIKYVFHDYIHTSLKILGEIQKRSGVNLREDNILFILSNKLKDICNQYGVFIMSATQLNGDWKESKSPDQNLLRGAKSIADKIDYGSILMNATQEDYDALGQILSSNVFDKPTIKLSVYKNRRGRYKGIYLWCKADLGCCRIIPMFCTTYDYEIIEIDDLKINLEEPGAF